MGDLAIRGFVVLDSRGGEAVGVRRAGQPLPWESALVLCMATHVCTYT